MMCHPNEVLHVVVYVLHPRGDQVVITGDRATIDYSPQHAGNGGTNVTVAGGSAPGPVTVSGTHGSAIGSQDASGANSRVAGSQAVQAGHDVAATGRDAAITGAGDQPVKEGWWARLRERGMLVALATVIGAIAAVAGTAVAVCVWIGWTP